MKKNEIEEYLDKWIETKIPKELQNNYANIVGALKSGFYEGIKFARLQIENKYYKN